MTTTLSLYAALSDDELLARVDALAASERHATVELIASLAELDARRLYLGAGCSSLFTYCTQVLHLSEHAAHGRIEAARAVRRHPGILQRLAEGSLTLTSVCLLAPVLSEQNALERALAVLVEDLEKKKLAATARPRRGRPTSAGSRHIPAAIRREVWRRDSGRCAFVGTEGRCTERGFLEIHHVVPFADGGETSVENLQLRCAAHNAHEAALWFGSGGAGFVKEEAGGYG